MTTMQYIAVAIAVAVAIWPQIMALERASSGGSARMTATMTRRRSSGLPTRRRSSHSRT
jgi:hypothetical protein